MISIIVSSYKSENFLTFSQNVKETIGDIIYEIVKIENPGIMGICEAYNIGIEKSQFSYFCFCHDDILFRTQNWGEKLIFAFQDNPDIGLIGCAGSTYKAWVPSGWASPQESSLIKLNLIQTKNDGRKLKFISANMLKKLEPVVSLDGCWLCTKKEITEEFRFDERTFRNYHCYDIDYSLQVFSKYKVVVIQDILIEHCSDGNFSSSWLNETYKLHAKWKELPKKVQDLTPNQISEQEMNAYSFLLAKTLELGTNRIQLLKVLFSLYLVKLLGIGKWLQLFKWTFCALLKKALIKK